MYYAVWIVIAYYEIVSANIIAPRVEVSVWNKMTTKVVLLCGSVAEQIITESNGPWKKKNEQVVKDLSNIVGKVESSTIFGGDMR